ncbi:MAG: YaeQ family protein [Gallionella sp.]|nr:YaeQ family protein [Gallionella sp.]
MALKSTIFKLDLQLADLDRNYYENHTLTLARHPSETDERMMMRVLAFILHADDTLLFGKGLSAEDEPDLWRKDLTGSIEQWIEVGLPDEKRLRRACGRAAHVVVLTYGGRAAEMWWQQNQAALARQEKLTVLDFAPEQTRALTAIVSRGMQLQCTLQEGELWLIVAGESLRITPEVRQMPR